MSRSVDMSRVCLLSLAALLVCAHAYEEEPGPGAFEGGTATLRCPLDVPWLHGNPPPKFTWKFGQLTIDGNTSRYRLMSDGALEIVSLYRNDTGVYICLADNGVGVATQEIHLTVNDPVRMPAGIAGDEDATVTGELGSPLHVRCLAYGFPPPFVFWYRGYEEATVLYNDVEYEIRGNDLIFRSLRIDTLGQYTCRAYNGVGNVASWGVAVRAYMPEGLFIEHEWLVPRGTVAPRPRTQPAPNATTTTTTTTTEPPRPLFTETTTAGEITETSEETLGSFEAHDHSTTNEDTFDVIGTTTLDPCKAFEFGCCADNETKAPGPDGQGCPCHATEFGCCPDLLSPAAGHENKGCCRLSIYGCCQDDKTPAHGPDFEGCCLLQPFDCCPDNRKPADGPHFEGCGCQYTLHGCCPDNLTVAQGPHNQGCGCQYTQHGCCSDRHTAASGPNYEGCACNTYQFGCCDDGVTIAVGPEQGGCHCFESKFGCCGDGETHATGPDAAGCDCSSSRHGCCPDGRSEATGSKFLGCTDAPENKQAACSMSTDPGPCHNFTAIWYYDLAYGSCSRFWYGGCDGNGNRFATKEECEDVCVQPSPKDACKLPSVKGACDADYQRWHYNSTREQCIPFRYGGCLGNANNFRSRELCQKQCEHSAVTGQCNLPIDKGSCAGNYSRWGFNSEVHRCEQFIWGGCEGNSNRFSTEAACQMRCAGTKEPQCTQPQEAGNCTEKEALWSFSQSENRCLPFYYSGCGGSDNRFRSRETCERTCPSTYVPDKCTLPAETGECSNYRQRWFYDTTSKGCRQFYYGGCGGNDNNFATEAECDNSCLEIMTTARAVEPRPQLRPAEPESGQAAPERSEFCFNAIDAGPCKHTETRYAYDSKLGRCVTFQFGGCGGNQNNFPNEFYCYICQLPMLQGPCEDFLMRCWFYDPTTDSCSQFIYGGCEGNGNRFETQRVCESRCKRPAPTTTIVATTLQQLSESECKTPSSLAPCGKNLTVFYYDSEKRLCLLSFGGCGNRNTFKTEEECERSCGTFRGIDVCSVRLDPGPCRGSFNKIYWDAASGSCQSYAYGGCAGGPNRFSNVEECMSVCGDTGPARACLQEVDTGHSCGAVPAPRYHYSVAHVDCVVFAYLGCGGNDNNFHSYEHCADVCRVSRTKGDDVPAAPLALPQQEPEVVASEGGTATLRCLFHGNPPPKITWRFGELTIDGNAGRYRLMSDGALEIVPLYHNDTGIYICVADNGLGVDTQAIHLAVNDPVKIPVGIAGDADTVVTGELGSPLHLRCLAYGYPPPFVFWYRGSEGIMVPYIDAVYEVRGNVLLIKSLALDTLGQYNCQAYNGEGKAASWAVLVRAYMPEGLFIENDLLEPRDPVMVPRPRTQPPTTAETNSTTTSTTTEAPRPLFTVPVSSHVSSNIATLNVGADLRLTCAVDGFPVPDMHWTKDGSTIHMDDRITITGSTFVSRLTVKRVTVSDSGLYACHASNPYSSQSDTAQINVQRIEVPAKCTDNLLFANCDLILQSKFCKHKHFSKLCCKSCVEAGQLNPQETEV